MKERKEKLMSNPDIPYVPDYKLIEVKPKDKDGKEIETAKPYLKSETVRERLLKSGQLEDNRKLANAIIQHRLKKKSKQRVGGNNRKKAKGRNYMFIPTSKIQDKLSSRRAGYNIHTHDKVKIQDSEISDGIYVKVKKVLKTILVWGEGEIMGKKRVITRKVFPPVEAISDTPKYRE